MKRCLILVLTVIVAVQLIGCGTVADDRVEDAVSESAPAVADNITDVRSENLQDEGCREPRIREVFPVTIGGGSDSLVTGFEEDLVVDAATDMPQQIPVYVDLYPVDQTGPQYEITAELKNLMKSNLKDFLSCLYQTSPGEDFDIQENYEGSFKATYQKDQLEFRAGLTMIRVFTEENMVPDVNGSLLENEIIAAGLKYLEIEDPLIKENHFYAKDGSVSVYEYKITQRSDDISESMADNSFRFIEIMKYADSDTTIISIEKNDPEEASINAVVSYDNVLSYVKEKYPDAEDGQITTEVYYDATIEEGYFMPYYKVYISQNSDNAPEGIVNVDTVYISMIG